MSKLTWEKRIAAAKEVGTFTFDDIDDASKWNRCAIGERFRIRLNSNEELACAQDVMQAQLREQTFSRSVGKLTELGVEFYTAVLENKPFAAGEIYGKIQRIYERHEAKKKVKK